MDNKIQDSILKGISKVVQIGMVLIFASAVAVGQDRMAALEDHSTVYNGIPISQDATKSAVLSKVISIDAEDVPLLEAVKEIAGKAHLEMVYNSKLLAKKNRHITIGFDRVTVEKALWAALEGTGLRFVVSADKQLVLLEQEKGNRLPQWTTVAPKKGVTLPPLTMATTQETITGTVTDGQSGETLPGVNILVKGTSTGTSTDSEGNFELTVESLQDTLVVSFIGYQTTDVPIQGRTDISIAMQTQTITGEEMVVVGYGTQEKSDLTGSVSVVDMDQVVKLSEPNLTNSLQGNASGVTVISSGQPGEEPNIRIRGINTFGDNSPLFVVDGLPTKNVADLNPNNIASMQVLKDASASIYGSRASNGVVIITTKKGSSGELIVSYDGYYGMQTVRRGNVWNLNSPQEMADLKWLVYENTAPDSPFNDPLYGNGEEPTLPDYIDPPGLSEGDPGVDPSLYNVDPYYTESGALNDFYRITKANKEGTDWFHEIFNNAPTMSHNLSFSGGDQNNKYFISMNYLNQEGTLSRTYLERFNIRANSEFNIENTVRVGENIQLSLRNNPQVNTLTEGGPIGMARRIQPIIPVHDIMGNFAGTSNGYLGVASSPVAQLERTRNDNTTEYRVLGNIYAEVDIMDNLNLRTTFGGSYMPVYSESFTYPEYEVSENNTTNSYSIETENNYNWTWSNSLEYQNLFNDIHDLTLRLGIESNKNVDNLVLATTNSYFSFDPNYTNLTTGSGNKLHSSSKNIYTLFSYYGRLNYSFNNKYLLNATIRRDGSSRFINHKYGWFPAVSVAWRISQEKFMQALDANWIDDLKIRASYGILGNQSNVDAANGYTTYNSDLNFSSYNITGSGNSLTEGFVKDRIGNPDAKWEKNINSNIGLDLGLFEGKLDFTIDYYRKEVVDMLYNPLLLGTAGQATRPYINIAQMENKGIDFSASSAFNLRRDLTLDARLTFTSYDNEIKKISNQSQFFDTDERRFDGSFIVRNEVGHPLGSFYGYEIAGFWDSEQEIAQANQKAADATGNPNAIYQSDIGIGRFRYADNNRDGQITSEDRTHLGNPNPDFNIGLNIGLNYKNFDFSMFLYGVYGNDIWNNVLWWTDFYSSFNSAKSHTALYDSWTPTNKNASAPIQEFTGSFSSANVPNSYFVKDGDYIRARNIEIGYNLPSTLLNRINVDRLRVYIQTTNLFTLTKYGGVDPEVSGGTTSFGIDEGAYPRPRSFLVGANITF